MNLYVQMIGGIGDLLIYMMKPNSPLGYFPALKARGDTTLVVAHANTDAAAVLFERLPYVDHLRFRGHSKRIDTAPGETFHLLKRYDDLHWEPPHLVLDDEEQRILADLVCGRYIAVHLTASLPEKMPPGYERLLDRLREVNRTIPVVLLGVETDDDGPPVKGNRAAGIRSMRGDFIVLPPKLRLHVAVAQCASKFIGTLSCFNCAAQLAAVPSFVLVNRSLQEPNVYRMMERNRAIVAPWNVGRPIDQIYDAAVEWARD